MRRAPDPIDRQAALLYDRLMHAPGTEYFALATVRAGRPLPSEAAIREACLPAAARAFWAKLAVLPDLSDEQRAAWVAGAAET